MELILILLLVLVVGFGLLAIRFRTPYPIVMVIGGLVLSLVPGLPRPYLQPEFVFLGVLPPLLFSAGFNTSWREFRYNLVNIALLAFGPVALTVVGVALLAQWIFPGFDWRIGLVLGAVVSTTDAVAATSIGRRLGLPPRIIDILEGESLVNDASGLLALEFTVGLIHGQNPGVAASVARLVYLILGGIVTGLLFGRLVEWLEHRIDHAPIEITISIVTPYASYLAADGIHASGVLAAVACGLYLGRRAATFFSSVVRIQAEAFWNTFTYILNGVVFVLIGLQLPGILNRIQNLALPRLLVHGALLSAIVIALRLLWIYPGAAFAYFIRRRLLGQHEPLPPFRNIFMVGWTGMRGVVALAAALSLPAAFPYRDLIVFLTFCVIFTTLVLQGLTLPLLIRRLGLAEQPLDRCEELEARRIMIEAALERLKEIPAGQSPETRAISEDVASHYRARLQALNRPADQAAAPSPAHRLYEEMTSNLRHAERAAAVQLRDQDRIGDETLRRLLHELDLLDARRASRETIP